MLTEDKKLQRQNCDSRVISNLLTGVETLVTMFEPLRRIDNNKQCRRNDQKRPLVFKRAISSKKVLYAIFYFKFQWAYCSVTSPLVPLSQDILTSIL